jgi:hypothetical protein
MRRATLQCLFTCLAAGCRLPLDHPSKPARFAPTGPADGRLSPRGVSGLSNSLGPRRRSLPIGTAPGRRVGPWRICFVANWRQIPPWPKLNSCSVPGTRL